MKFIRMAAVITALAASWSCTGTTQADAATNTPAAAAPALPPLFAFSDTSLEYRFESGGSDPGFSGHFVKHIANLTHVDAFTYGTNFVSIDILQSTNQDPAAPSNTSFVGEGSREVYGLYRGTLSGNAVSGSKVFSFGFIKDVSLGYGFDLESQNTAFAPQKSDVVFGPQLSFDVPGYLTLQANVYKEWNHNGLAGGFGFPSNEDFNAQTGRVSFQPTAEFEVTYLQPIAFAGLPLSVSGFTNIVLPKGRDGFGNSTRTEILSSNRLNLDIGQLVLHRPKLVNMFVGYKYWLNKFGNNAHYGDASFTAGSYESQIFAGLAVHL